MYQIRYFLVLGETLNFSRAAERCNVTQPSLTRAIKALEAELGGELIRRERSLSHLTDLGERMTPLLKQCYETALAAKAVASAVTKGALSPVSVIVSRSVNLAMFTPYLNELSRAFPGLQLSLRRASSSEITELLKTGDVELAVAGPLGTSWERLDSFPLFTEPFHAVFNRQHRLSAQTSASMRDLMTETLLIDSDGELMANLVQQLSAAGIENIAQQRAVTDADLTSMLEADLGVAILPASTALSDALGRVQVEDLDLTRTISVYGVAGRRRTPAGNSLLSLLRVAQWPSYAGAAALQGVA